jgi:hypothetical protein
MAYGTNAPFGLQPRMTNTGAAWNGQTNTYSIASGYGTSIFQGDPIQTAAGFIVIGNTTGTANAGVFMGCQYTDITNTPQFSPFWPANTVTLNGAPATAFVVDDPTILFDIQSMTSGAIGNTTTVTQAQLGFNANFVLGAGSTISGQSGAYLDVTTIAATATLNLKIIRITPAFTNQPGLIGAAPYTGGQNIAGLRFNNVLVQLNNDIYKGGTGTLGV